MIITRDIREEWFTADELAIASGFRLPKRREEWLRSRTAAKALAVERGIVRDPRACTVARPTLLIDGEPSQWHVSLSHSRGWAAAAIDAKPVGIDLEVVRPVDERAVHLFLREDEAEAMHGCSIADRMLHFWAAKEAAWKQRSGQFTTLKQLALQLIEVRESGLLFDAVETFRRDDLVVALTRSTS